jgi:hypothetical protein
LCGLDAKLLTGLADQADLSIAELFVDLLTLNANTKTPPKKIKTDALTASASQPDTTRPKIMLTSSRILEVRTDTTDLLLFTL